MRLFNLSIMAAALAAALPVLAQGTFIYDQESSDEATPGESAAGIQVYQPMGQSFTPALSSVGFIRLELYDGNPGNSLGGMVYVNLRMNSITGPILATAVLPDGLGSPPKGWFTDFLFNSAAPVTPGTMYYIQPVVASGDTILAGSFIPTHPYLGGTIIINGAPNSAADLWFREGVIVPEPRAALLVLLGSGVFACARRMRFGKLLPRRP
jgi:hypothetical protein